MAELPQNGLAGQFRTPRKAFRGVKVEAAASVISSASDVALVLDKTGRIEDVASQSDTLSEAYADSLIGKDWKDTVASDSVSKVEMALEMAADDGQSTWLEINHTMPGLGEVSVKYLTVALKSDERFLALGRDLRETVTLQRRLVQAQQEMEREYSRVRQAETRYRLLFQFSSEPVVIADAQSLRVREMNPAAQTLLRIDANRIEGKSLASGFAASHASDISTLFATARAAGMSEMRGLRLARNNDAVDAVATLFSFGRASHMLVKLRAANQPGIEVRQRSLLMELIDSAPEAFVVTDVSGNILAANPSFLELAQAPTLDAVEGHRLDRWLGRPGAEYAALEMQVKQDGAARFFETIIRGALGDVVDVEVSGVSAIDAVPPCFGFVVRSVGGRLKGDVSPRGALPEAVEQMRELVGRVPLKDLVRETTDIIERMCIEAALEITNDNRASAAEILGLSRQSLYVKLRRYGLDDADPDRGS
ncbi:MAG: transcriptional regulator PpsR [Pseudomonadota bacterium]